MVFTFLGKIPLLNNVYNLWTNYIHHNKHEWYSGFCHLIRVFVVTIRLNVFWILPENVNIAMIMIARRIFYRDREIYKDIKEERLLEAETHEEIYRDRKREREG